MLSKKQSSGLAASGVLDARRAFTSDPAAADRYLASAVALADRLEPRLKAFEYRPKTYPAVASGPLGGIPVAIKDIIATRDMPTTNGSPIYRDHVPANDAWIVERLRALGATIFGKTVTTEFAWRQPGPTVNAWNRDHTPGGSSSGSAAAVAAGIVPLALGTQTLGSIIRPAAYNGIVGFKPSYGAIPRVGVHPLSGSLDHLGFFARHVEDIAYALSLLAGQSESDPHGVPLPGFVITPEHGIAPLAAPRLGVARLAFWSKAESAQQQIFDETITRLRNAGAQITELEFPELDHSGWQAVQTIMACEAAVIFTPLIEKYPDKISDWLKQLVATGKAHSSSDYREALDMQAKLRELVEHKTAGFDSILTLPAFGEAPKGLSYTGDAQYCAPWTLMGLPAISLPAGFGPQGLPLGVQLAGHSGQDFRLLQAARFVESVLAFSPRISDALAGG